MMCEEPAAASRRQVEPPRRAPADDAGPPEGGGIDFSRCARRRRGAGRSAARVRAVAASRTSRRRGRRSRCRDRAPHSLAIAGTITISLLAVFALVKVLSAVGILDVDFSGGDAAPFIAQTVARAYIAGYIT